MVQRLFLGSVCVGGGVEGWMVGGPSVCKPGGKPAPNLMANFKAGLIE